MEPVEQSVYVISLDAVDLNLLPTIYNTRDERIVPLWTKSNLERRNNEYYRFEIKSKDPEDVIDKTPKLEFENTTCYICDIEVPKPFFNKHRNSLRHKTNLKIANIAMKRLMKYINNTDNVGCADYDEVDPHAYFCAKCTTVIDAKEKETHNKSLAHRNSLVLEKIFNDYLTLYHSNEEINDVKANKSIKDLEEKIYKAMQRFVSGNKNEDDSLKSSNESIEKPTKANDNLKWDAPATDIGSEIISFANYSASLMQCDSPNGSNESIERPTKENYKLKKDDAPETGTENEMISLKDYLASINKRVEHPMLFKMQNENNLIEIETIDGSVVKVREENFLGFNRVGKKLMQCFACKEIFKEKMLEKHKMSEKHIQYMIAPLKDKHCARQINESLTHCLICNTITENSDLHSLCDKDHWKYLKEALISDKLVEELPSCKESHFYWDKPFKDLNLDKYNNINMISNANEIQKTYINNEEKWSIFDMESIQTKRIQEPSVMPNKLFCTACNEYISSFRKHNKTKKHVFHVNSKSKHHYLMRVTENALKCIVCDVKVTDNDEYILKHVLENDHSQKYNQLLKDNKMKRVNKDIFYCKVCDEIILFKNELIHMNAKSHLAKCFTDEHMFKADDKNSDDDVKVSTEYYYCNVCDVKVPNYGHNIEEHLTGRSHCSKVEKSDPTSDVNKDKQNEVAKIHYQMEPTEYSNILNCRVCQANVSHNELAISKHLMHISHMENYKIFLKDNYLVLTQENCFCIICKVDVGIKSEILHVLGKKHNKNMTQMLSGTNVLTDTNITGNPSMSNIKPVKIEPPYVTAGSKSNPDTAVPEEYYCRPCCANN
ncbi:jg26226 [Pararge aegeria aegeria]|uniref:Jg26226 protein n=1 Tax=Pararge aegeria aegeria TaxID=348720 RepID=A0A8S4RWU1_9NEOP|nr:jg26226 [Pararge aegeria aegeria]